MNIFSVISLLGGLSMFLYGIEVMGDGLKNSSSAALKNVLEKVTTNTLMGVLTGTLVTAVIQSSTATIVPLTLAAAPLVGRMVESSLKEVPAGVIEAALSMGAKTGTIVRKVLIGEARTSLLVGGTIVLGTVLGYSAMAGVIGGGGLGDIAIRYGYYRYDTGVMLVTLVFIVAIVQLLQGMGNLAARKIDHRK